MLNFGGGIVVRTVSVFSEIFATKNVEAFPSGLRFQLLSQELGTFEAICVPCVCIISCDFLKTGNLTFLPNWLSRWWQLTYVFIFTPIWGRFPIWRAYVSNGLVQPPPSCFVRKENYSIYVSLPWREYEILMTSNCYVVCPEKRPGSWVFFRVGKLPHLGGSHGFTEPQLLEPTMRGWD